MKNNKLLSLLSLVFISGVLLPPTYLYLSNVFPMVYASESIGYRFYHSLRILEGDFSVRLPQGHLINLLQKIKIFIAWFNLGNLSFQTPEILFKFSYYTIALNCTLLLIGSGLFFINNYKSILRMFIFYLIILLAIYGSRSGISAWVSPDYYATEIGLIALSFGLFFAGNKDQVLPSKLLGGIVFGAILATKINLVLIPISLLIICNIDKPKKIITILYLIVCYITLGLVTWAFILAAFYWPKPLEAINWFSWFYNFAKNPGGEVHFWENLFVLTPKLHQGADYTYFSITVAFFIICIINQIKNKTQRFSLLYSITIGILSIYLLIKRPAGTTLWEISLLLLVLSGCLLMKEIKTSKSLLLFLIWFFQLALKTPADCQYLIFNKELKNSSISIQNIHQKVLESSKILCFFPSNENTCGSIEEGILKGFSDFPSWQMTDGKRILLKYYPMLLFTQTLTEQSDSVNSIFYIASHLLPIDLLLCDLNNFHVSSEWNVKTFPWWEKKVFILNENNSKK